MRDDVGVWLERLTALHKSSMRRAASAEGLRLVHLEILDYLSICNKYSNTAQALCEFLGQTKGSISQSLAFLETGGYIRREEDMQDRRCTRLFLTEQGNDCLLLAQKAMLVPHPNDQHSAQWAETLKEMIVTWQAQSDGAGFGLCRSCRHNCVLENGDFRCGLTGDPLTTADTSKLCREHEF